MNLEQFLTSKNVIEIGTPYDQKYENLENIIGKQYWICDFRLNKDRDAKPIRNVPPKRVQVFSNDTLPKGKNVYYSPIHFREVKNGKILSGIIAPYDNTGYRSYPGISVNIFDTETECVNCFIKLCDIAIKQYEEELDRRTKEIKNKIDEIKEHEAKFS